MSPKAKCPICQITLIIEDDGSYGCEKCFYTVGKKA